MSVTIVDAMRRQQRACADLGFPFYAHLLEGCTADVETGGPVAEVFAGKSTVRSGDLLPLRFLGGVHRLVLERSAPELALHYPSVGGDGDGRAAWPAFRRVVAKHQEALEAALATPPQTNDVGRSALLAGALGLLQARYHLPLRLFEIGASAGLNLRVDHFRFESGAGTWGPADAEVVLHDAVIGAAPWGTEPLRIVERRGCDLDPVDPNTTEGRLRLTSFVWPDDSSRLARLRAALRTAERIPAEVVRQDALAFASTLAPSPGTMTVVWHSVALMYLERSRREAVTSAIDALGRSAEVSAPVAEIAFEPIDRDAVEFPVRVRLWPDGVDEPVAMAPPHGIPSRWEVGAL